MDQRAGLAVLLTLRAAVGSTAVDGENVLVIPLDDVGVDHLSVYGEGSDYALTPHGDSRTFRRCTIRGEVNS